MIKKFFFLCVFFALEPVVCSYGQALYVDPRGIWVGTDIQEEHCFDLTLAADLALFFQEEGAESIVDFGCGLGQYVEYFRCEGIQADGFDGNPNTPELTRGLCKVIDLSLSFDLVNRYDWVVSLEVGEHLPPKYERIFIENLIRHSQGEGIVLSWAIKGQGGLGHVNEQNNDYIKKIFLEYHYISDNIAEARLRESSSISWFKNTIMVFRKNI